MIVRALASILALATFFASSTADQGGPDVSFAAQASVPAQWWRCTGHLRARDGRRFDFTLAIFRYGGFVSDERARTANRWAGGTTFSATLGIVDESQRTFVQDERRERALGIASAAADRLAIRIADWTLAANARAANAPVTLRAGTDSVKLDLRLLPTKPAFAFADGEVDRPSLRARGTLVVDRRRVDVRGDAWLDTTFGTRARAAGAIGWNRYCIELDDGRAMLYETERRSDGTSLRVRATLVGRAGEVGPLPLPGGSLGPGVATKARAGWRSLRTGARYPNIWSLNLPSLDMQISLEPVLYEQEIVAHGGVPFWSGAVEIYDVRPGSDGLRLGRGYVELTGYAPPVAL